jgi:hypothetical protein
LVYWCGVIARVSLTHNQRCLLQSVQNPRCPL